MDSTTPITRRTLHDVEIEGGRVLIRVDYNVPLTERGAVADDRRIRASLPTIRHVTERGACAVLLSHLGRPKGHPDPRLSLRPVAQRLAALLPEHRVRFVDAFDGPGAAPAVAAAKPGEVLLLENVRFHPGEKANAPEYAAGLAALGTLFVQDAFSICHRAHASVVGVPRHLPGVCGIALAGELAALEPLLRIDRSSPSPPRPFCLVAGGAKVSDKIALLEALIPRLDRLLIGGAMAYTFLHARGEAVGRSRLEPERLEVARRLLEQAQRCGADVLLPCDHVVAPSPEAPADALQVQAHIPPDAMALDIGPRTRARFREALADAHTIVWNGPLGLFERDPFAAGTQAIAQALAERAQRGATVVLGGGETAQCAERFGVARRVTHVSTGGGAFLAFLEGEELPGLRVLQPAEPKAAAAAPGDAS